jgi:parallel beta-helix repeat protein
VGTIVNAKDHYVAATGNDANDGLTPATAWQSITKVNTFFKTAVAGDAILFKCGDTFYGSLVVGKAGTAAKPIVIGAYGTGAKPVITGFTTVTAWTSAGANLWQSVAIAGAKNTNMVMIGNKPTPMGRYPNSGYLTFESSVGNTSITDNELTASPNWKGAELVIRKNHWTLSRDVIISHSGTKITYNGTSAYNSINNFGYFIQNSLTTLDAQNEWYFDNATRKLTIYSSSSPVNVKVANIDTLLYIGQHDYITVDGIAFEGANQHSIIGGSKLNNATTIKIRNCSINYSGKNGMSFTNAQNCLIEYCTVNNSWDNGILFQNEGGESDNNIIQYNRVSNTGTVAGMNYCEGNSNQGISLYGQNNTIQYNTVDTTGYAAIYYEKNNSKVKYNKVNYFCFVKDDGGGIYTHTGYTGKVIYTGRQVIGNTVLNGIGAGNGTADGTAAAMGIYSDDGSTWILIDSNTVSATATGGIYIHNSQNITVTNNLVYDAKVTQLLIVHDNLSPNTPVRGLILKNNQFVAKSTNSTAVTIRSIRNDLDSINLSAGAINNNYYSRPFDDNLTIHTEKTVGGIVVKNDYTLDSWKASFPKYDMATKKSPVTFPTYQISNLVTPNLVANGQLTTDAVNFGIFSGGANTTMAWDNSGKISGAGSLRITPLKAGTGFTIIFGNKTSVGTVNGTKKYIMRFTTRGSGDGILKAYIRQFNSPYNPLTAKQNGSFGKEIKVHEFLFTAPVNDATATFAIEVQDATGITYIDDVQFYEAITTALDPTDKIRFEYNASVAPLTVSLGSKNVSIDSNIYNGSITLKAFTSSVLLKTGPIDAGFKADAGTDISLVLPINSTVLKGSASGGTVVSYSWTKIAGPAQYAMANANSPSTNISNLAMGKYTFQFKVINTAGDSAIATVNVVALGVLPVTLIDFTAQNNLDKIDLRWKVASEINVSHYTVERSGNGHSFESIGEVAANNLFTAQNYHYDDNFPLQGINYYRLVMVDKDGTTKYSKIISANESNVSSFKLNQITLSVNNNNLKIAINSNYEQVMQIVLADVSGRILYANPIQLQKGVNNIDKKMPAINTGIYYAKLIAGDQVITKPLLSER